MYKVLIIDDEPSIREGLRIIINWAELGFYLCGEAADGIEGLEKIKELRPDLVVADIMMPGIDGLQMIEDLNRLGIVCEYIILTGYSDFQFAQKAINSSVAYYLLKPIDSVELGEYVARAYREIDARHTNYEYLEDTFVMSKEKILADYICGKSDAALVDKYNLIYGYGFPWNSYQIIMIHFTKMIGDDCSIHCKLSEITERFIEHGLRGIIFIIDGKLIILARDQVTCSNAIFLSDIFNIIKRVFDVDSFLAAGSIVSMFENIVDSYQNASELMQNRFVFGGSGIITWKDYEDLFLSNKQDLNRSINIEDTILKLFMAVDTNNVDSIGHMLNIMNSDFIKQRCTEYAVKACYAHIYATTINRLALCHENLGQSLMIDESVFDEISRADNLVQLQSYLTYKLVDISDELEKINPSSTIIDKLLDYVYRNYDTDIKLDTLSHIFNYNSAYLGKMFCKYTGMHFNNFLDKVRMEKAREYLRKGYKVYQVSKMVGYENPKYFYEKFKKYNDTTPSVYGSICEHIRERT